MKIPATWTERDVITSSSSSSTSTKPQQQQRKPQQCLRFAPTIEVAEIPNRFDYSREEIEDSWFQSHEYEEFRENAYMTVGLFRAGLLPGGTSKDHCMRGLECRLVEVAREREQTRYQVTAAVLNEQYRQYRLGYVYPQAIADLYHAVSWKSQYGAYTRAMLDEQEQEQLKKTFYHKSNSSRRSDAKNVLRKVIDIERVDNEWGMDASCSSQSIATSSADFDINSFFQELTIAAQ
ncbi:expressed unknown protein [Seminavis robusta]|uniref:Uncharacterized protein n=1 Tax=Seminavis robusta TaxID=568900 RepID=A0A9N8E4G2_9STRA|nr:expressed unknown protein [Seminavis robusta]|eukprot:Sro655_g182310.1 n/a (235) ;mRNA; f:40855-41559